MKIAIVGSTGLVGQSIIQILERKKYDFSNIIFVSSNNSIGKKIKFRNYPKEIIHNKECIAKLPDIVFMSAGADVSKEWALQYAKSGSKVIDNSSAWRMDPKIKLIVPEINSHLLNKGDKIIANPNCSTIQLVLVLAPLHKKYNIKRIVVSTYQSVTGSGYKGLSQLNSERHNKSIKGTRIYPYQIDLNIIPHIDKFIETGYTKEEMKVILETKKILNDQTINITCTAVRVPVIGGHGESVNIEFENEYNIKDIIKLLTTSPGVKVQNDYINNIYPMPITSKSKGHVFVGRIRRDNSQKKSLNLWIVSDPVIKGAALNAVQIMEKII